MSINVDSASNSHQSHRRNDNNNFPSSRQFDQPPHVPLNGNVPTSRSTNNLNGSMSNGRSTRCRQNDLLRKKVIGIHSSESSFVQQPHQELLRQSRISSSKSNTAVVENDFDKKQKAIIGVGDTHSNAHSSNQASDTQENEQAENEGGFLAKCLRVVPFTVLVVLLLFIPVGFLTVYSILSFVEHSATLSYVQHHAGLVSFIVQCDKSLMRERTTTTLAMVSNTSQRWGAMLLAQRESHSSCTLVSQASTETSDKNIATKFSDELNRAREQLVLSRHMSETGDVSPHEMREKIGEFLCVLNSGLSIVGTDVSMRENFLEIMLLKLVRSATNYMSLCGDVGAEIIIQNTNYVIDHHQEGQMYSCHDHFLTTVRELQSISMLQTTRRFVQFIETDAVVKTALTMISSLIKDPHAVPLFTLDEWLDVFAKLRTEFHTRSNEVEYVKELKQSAQGVLIAESFKLAGALLGCIVAMVVIIRANTFIQRRMDATLTSSRNMQNSIRKFVPRQFLRICGCTSILHVTAGDQTQVAITMMHSNIKNFSVVSEQMGNEELFTWIQSFLARMTQITERNHGFIEQYMGDALFSVFTSAQNSIRCGVDVVTSVGQLNLDFKSKRLEKLIEIGVGLHHGIVCAGFLGDESRLTVALVSSEVNVASQLEQISSDYGAQILVSQPVIDQVRDLSSFECRSIGMVRLPNSIKSFNVVDIFQADEVAMKSYKAESKNAFEEGVAQRANGNLVKGNLLLERCRTMAAAVDIEDRAVEHILQSSHRQML